MNRRDFFSSTIAAGAAALVPSWLLSKIAKPAMDLSPFCALEAGHTFEMRQPFIQAAFAGIAEAALGEREYHRYATNGRIAVRVAAEPHERDLASELKLPPASNLNWSHDRRRGWRPWPRQDYRLARDTKCPRCKGTGCDPVECECQYCNGVGELFTSEGNPIAGTRCAVCRGAGWYGPCCSMCGGNGDGTFPGLQPIMFPCLDESVYIATEYDALIRKHLGECEYWLPANVGEQTIAGQVLKPIMFRFDGGLGLVCPIDRDGAKRRVD